MLNVLTCGADVFGGTDITQIASITRLVVTIIKIFVPVALVIVGMIDLGKAVVAGKEDEIKKGQQTLIKRCITAAIVFFIISVVQILIGVLAPSDEKSNITTCFNCFISDEGAC